MCYRKCPNEKREWFSDLRISLLHAIATCWNKTMTCFHFIVFHQLYSLEYFSVSQIYTWPKQKMIVVVSLSLACQVYKKEDKVILWKSNSLIYLSSVGAPRLVENVTDFDKENQNTKGAPRPMPLKPPCRWKTPKPSSKTLRNHKLSAAERWGFAKRSELPQGSLGVDLIDVCIL